MRPLIHGVFFLWMVMVFGSHVIAQLICRGDCSVIGLENWDDTVSLFSSKMNLGHGSLLGGEVVESLKIRFGGELPLKRSADQRSSNLPNLEAENRENEVSCCKTKTSVIYPLSGYSAVTGSRVTVLQIPAMRQPVVLQECDGSKSCHFLRGNCTQVYSPVPLYVLPESGKRPEFDYVLVESGCRCSQVLDQYPKSTGVDGIVKQALSHITGPDFDADQLIIEKPRPDVAPNANNLGTKVTGTTVKTTTIERIDNSTTLTPNLTEWGSLTSNSPIEPQSTANQTLSKVSTTTAETSTTRKSSTKTTETTAISTSLPTTTQILNVSTFTASTTTTPEPDTTTLATTERSTVLPLPPLPPPGQPIEIKPGFFNPAAVFLRPRSRARAQL